MEAVTALCLAMMCFALSGARSWVYALYFASYVPFISLSAVEGGLTEVSGLGGSNVGFKLAIRAACSLGFLIIIARQKHALSQVFRASSLPILVLFAWSLAWLSRSQSPWISLFRLTELFAFFFAGVALYLQEGRKHRLRDVLRWHCLALFTLPLLSLWFSWLRPELVQHEGSGAVVRWGHKLLNANSLGFSCTVVLLWATNELKASFARPSDEGWRGRWVPVLAVAICGLVFLMARSRSAALLLLVGQTILWWPQSPVGSRLRLRLAAGLLMGVGICLWQWSNIEPWFLRGESASSLATATGRTHLWQELITRQTSEQPVAGAGYLMLSDQGGFLHEGRMWTNAHNTYLFALVSTGWVGFLSVLCIVLWPLLACARAVRRAPIQDFEPQRLLFALIAVVALASITGFGVFGFPNPAMLLFYSLYALVLAEKRSEGVHSTNANPRPSSVGYDATPIQAR
ncbi:MAG: O-antigen ligase family protein [Planctomycetes bacterium]|nr:O-antigen ligase family protein [Planctomycetota bacterium]